MLGLQPIVRNTSICPVEGEQTVETPRQIRGHRLEVLCVRFDEVNDGDLVYMSHAPP